MFGSINFTLEDRKRKSCWLVGLNCCSRKELSKNQITNCMAEQTSILFYLCINNGALNLYLKLDAIKLR
jgi:hypothetical protein